jgi:hypothetical protein
MFSYLFRIIGIFILVLLLHQGWIYLHDHFFNGKTKTNTNHLANRQIEKYKAMVEEIQRSQVKPSSEFLSQDDKTEIQKDLALFMAGI